MLSNRSLLASATQKIKTLIVNNGDTQTLVDLTKSKNIFTEKNHQQTKSIIDIVIKSVLTKAIRNLFILHNLTIGSAASGCANIQSISSKYKFKPNHIIIN